MTELKPCPHCNGKVQLEDHLRLGFIIYCEQCQAIFTLDDWKSKEKELIKAWCGATNYCRRKRQIKIVV